MQFVNSKAYQGTLLAHIDGGTPNIVFEIDRADEWHFGYLVYFFEKACGISGYLLGVYDWWGNPATEIVNNTQQSLTYPTDVLNIKDSHNPGYLTQANNMLYQYYSALLKYKKTFAWFTQHIRHDWHQRRKVCDKRAAPAAARENFEDSGVYDLNLASGTQGNGGEKRRTA